MSGRKPVSAVDADREQIVESICAAIRAGGKLRVVLIGELINASWDVPAPRLSGPRPSQCEEDVVTVLTDAGHRMTQEQVCGALSTSPYVWGESTVKQALARMVKDGRLNRDPDANPKGYGLPHWLTGVLWLCQATGLLVA